MPLSTLQVALSTASLRNKYKEAGGWVGGWVQCGVGAVEGGRVQLGVCAGWVQAGMMMMVCGYGSWRGVREKGRSGGMGALQALERPPASPLTFSAGLGPGSRPTCELPASLIPYFCHSPYPTPANLLLSGLPHTLPPPLIPHLTPPTKAARGQGSKVNIRVSGLRSPAQAAAAHDVCKLWRW